MKPKVKRRILPKVKVVIAVSVLFLVIILLTKMVLWGQRFMNETGLTPYTTFRLLFNTGVKLSRTDGHANVLLLGIGGGHHTGWDLTDTMVVLSLNLRAYKGAMISIPRDVWSDTLADKVNSAYHYGEEKKKGGGIVLAKAVAEDVTGLPIHYVLLIDFSGFKDVIDQVGGVTIDVKKAFTDNQFPIAGKENDECDGDPQHRCRYEVLVFNEGKQTINGERALKYIRSRHAEGDEGSDFARSKRQQEVLLALKENILSSQIWLSPNKIVKLIKVFDAATQTDMNIGELATIGKIFVRTKDENILRINLDSLLVAPPLWLYGRYVLVPKDSFSAIHDYIEASLSASMFLQ